VLDAACRAEIYLGLARQLEAGLDAARALDGLSGACRGRAAAALADVRQLVSRGTALAEAGRRRGLWFGTEHRAIDTGERAGAPWRALAPLAVRRRAAHERGRRILGQMLMPGFVLLVALASAPLPALVAGRIDLADYLLAVLGPLAALVVIAWSVARVLRGWRAHGAPALAWRAAAATGPGASLVRTHERAGCLEGLALLLDVGLPAADALQAIADQGGAPDLRARLRGAARAVRTGGGLTEALGSAELLTDEARAIVSAGESAGRTEACVAQAAVSARARLDETADLAAIWLPRAVYAAVVVVVAHGLLG
jgi:type II secretory pathway component PulF